MLTKLTISPGRQGTKDTLRIMRRMIDQYKRCPYIRKLSVRIIQQAGAKNSPLEKLRALWNWTKRNIDYVSDIAGVEYIQAPRKLIESGAGDCDDMAVLIGSMAESVGLPVQLKAVKLRGRDNFSHVFPVIKYKQYEVAADATIDKCLGYQPTNTVDIMYS